MTTVDDQQTWRLNAACRHADANLFFPDHGSPEARRDRYAPARRICRHCPVKPECLRLVIDMPPYHDQWGMFGGLTPTERRHLRRRPPPHGGAR